MEKYYTYKEIAQMLSVHWITVKRWCASGDMQTTVIGGGKSRTIRRISETNFQEFLKNKNT